MTPTQLPDRTDWRRVLILVGAGVAVGWQMGKVPPSLIALRAELNLSLFVAGWVVSLFHVVAAVGAAVAGAAAERLGQRRTALVGLGVTAAASLVGSLAHGPALLLPVRVLEGVGYVTISVSAPVLIFQATSLRDQRLALSAWSCYMPAGTSTMMLLSPLFLESVGWRGLWAANALFVAVLALVLRRTVPPPERADGAAARPLLPGLRDSLSKPGPLLLAAYFLAFAVQFTALAGFLPTLLVEDVGMSKASAAVFSGVAVLLNVPGNLLGGWLLQRGVRRRANLWFASSVMGLGALGIYTHVLPDIVRCALCLAFFAVGGLIPSSLYAAVPSVTPPRSSLSTANGIMMQGAGLGSMAGPPAVAAVVAAGGGWWAAPWLSVSAAAVTLVLAVLLDRAEAAALSAHNSGPARP